MIWKFNHFTPTCWKKGMALVLMITFAAFNAAWAAKPKRPNIVWLVSEDNTASWLKLYDPQHGAPMPTIERLAQQGIVFNNAYSNAPVCSVARSSIISGCYAPRVGAQYHRRLQPVPMPAGVKMFPYYLRQAGYYTTNCSKEDYNFLRTDVNGVWDESSGKATFRNRKKPDQPFFHIYNDTYTHESCLHPGRKGGYYDKTKTDPASVKLAEYHPDTQVFRHAYARYLDRHTEIDAHFANVVKQLEDDGLMDDTFIFYYGDNGGILPRSKGYAYNNGLQVPMVVYIPKNFKHLAPCGPNTRVDGFVQFIDLSATVLNLAGIKIPDNIDGKPFLGPGVSLQKLNQRDMTYGYADRFDEKYDLVRSIRKGHYFYMRNYQPFNFDGLYNRYRYIQPAYQDWLKQYKAGKLNAKQRQFFEPRPAECLYDLDTDPDQVNNLADDPAYAVVTRQMRTLMQKQVKSMPDLSLIPEPVMLAEALDNPVAYGQKNKARIAALVDTADLMLLPFDQARPQIQRALNDTDDIQRYWAWIVCSAFGKEALVFVDQAKTTAASDPSNLVRARAAEFLGLTQSADPRPYISYALTRSSDKYEMGLILNTVTLLQDSIPHYQFQLNNFFDKVKPTLTKEDNVMKWRIEYLKK